VRRRSVPSEVGCRAGPRPQCRDAASRGGSAPAAGRQCAHGMQDRNPRACSRARRPAGSACRTHGPADCARTSLRAATRYRAALGRVGSEANARRSAVRARPRAAWTTRASIASRGSRLDAPRWHAAATTPRFVLLSTRGARGTRAIRTAPWRRPPSRAARGEARRTATSGAHAHAVGGLRVESVCRCAAPRACAHHAEVEEASLCMFPRAAIRDYVHERACEALKNYVITSANQCA
jgi:hypothetical protein